jgi:hypothetical protein
MDTEEKDELDARLEMRLGDELRNQLDRQIGRAAPHFLKRYAARSNGPRVRRQRYARRLAALAVAAAILCTACVVWQRGLPWNGSDEPVGELVVVATHADIHEIPANHVDDAPMPASEEAETDLSSDSELGVARGHTGVAEPLVVGRILKTRTLDEGTMLVGRTPVRKVRRQWLERVEWFDPQNRAHVQRIVPHEEVMFVPLPIN